MNPPNTDPILAGQQLLINEYRETIPLPTQQTLNKIFDMVTSWKPKCIFFFGNLYLVPKFTSWRYSQSQLLKEIEKVIRTLNLCAKVNTAQSPNNEKYKWGPIDKLLTKILKSIEELIEMNQKLESLFSRINEHYTNHIQYLIKNVSGSQPKACVNSENTINSSRINLHSLVKDLAGLIKHEQDHINVSGVFKSDAELNKFTEALVEETVKICQRSKEIMDCSKNSKICDLEAYRSILLQLHQPLTEVLPCCVAILTHVRFIAQQFTCLNQQLMCLGIETKSSSLGN